MASFATSSSTRRSPFVRFASSRASVHDAEKRSLARKRLGTQQILVQQRPFTRSPLPSRHIGSNTLPAAAFIELHGPLTVCCYFENWFQGMRLRVRDRCLEQQPSDPASTRMRRDKQPLYLDQLGRDAVADSSEVGVSLFIDCSGDNMADDRRISYRDPGAR
jgi:hypothetical protein